MIRVAAVADVHVGADSAGRLRPRLEHVPDHADDSIAGNQGWFAAMRRPTASSLPNARRATRSSTIATFRPRSASVKYRPCLSGIRRLSK